MIFRFANPEYFYLVLLIPVLWIVISVFAKSRKKSLEKSIGTRILPFLMQSASLSRVKWKNRLLTLSILFLILALARPQGGQATTEIRNEGIELIFAVDVSNSMLAEDVKPSRLELAKKTIQRLMDKMTGHKVGLVAFAGSAAAVSPMTGDYPAVAMYLETLGPDSVGRQGTQFKLALESAVELFDRGGVGQEEGSHATQAIVILSDGEDNEPGAIEAAKKVSESGRLIFTVGVGTAKGAPIPVRDEFGVLKEHKKDNAGNTVLTVLKEDPLKELATAGGGDFYVATVVGSEVNRITAAIDKLGKALYNKKQSTDFTEYYQIPLYASFFLLLGFLLISTRRNTPLVWKGRFEVGTK